MKTILMMTTLAAALAIFVAAANANEHSGTWKQNPAKSRYSSGPGLKNLTETVVLDEKSYKVEANGTAANGAPVHIEFNARFDGKEYPMIGVPWADSVSVTWIDARTPQMLQKKAGEVTVTTTCKVSKDGKTRTCTLKGKDEQGREVNNVAVFDRQ